MDEKEIRKELRKVRHKETEILTRNRFAKGFSLESILNKYIPDSLESTLHTAFREAFRLIFDKGAGVIGKTFNEDKARASGGSEAEAQKQWMTDILLTSVEGTGLGLLGIGVPDIAVFTGMLLRSVYQTAASYQFEYTTKTEQVFILKLIEGALTRGRKAEELSAEVDDLMHRIDTEDFTHYGNINQQIEAAAKALSEETLYLKFVQTIPIVGVAGGLSNPIYLNKVKNYADVKYHKRRLLIQQRQAAAARGRKGSEDAQTHQEEPALHTESQKGVD
ncbi:MAG: EcsC family protein [Firmicutes bacterium]|nr:EcsC family protein [Bacillota bacterium]